MRLVTLKQQKSEMKRKRYLDKYIEKVYLEKRDRRRKVIEIIKKEVIFFKENILIDKRDL